MTQWDEKGWQVPLTIEEYEEYLASNISYQTFHAQAKLMFLCPPY